MNLLDFNVAAFFLINIEKKTIKKKSVREKLSAIG